MNATYKWAHPSEWLTDKINDYENLADLRALARHIADQLDGDQIQDLFQDEMDADGYFEPLHDEE